MLIRICPLCDSEMKRAHYCDVCHSFVWKPQVLDIHYNTDSRGRGEIDCAYGEVHDAHDHQIPQYKSWQKPLAETQPAERARPARPVKDARTSIGRAVFMIIIIITIIDVLASLFVSLF